MQRAKRVIINGAYATRNKGSKRVPHVLVEATDEEYKYCSKCGSLKPLEDFHDNIRTWDFKTSFCKECTGEIMKRNYERRKWKKQHPDEPYPEQPEIAPDRYDLTTILDAAYIQLGTSEIQLIDYVKESVG